MKVRSISIKETFFTGLMLFAIFFGAGNLIFPLSLGQAAGTELIPAILGFLMTGVGLPLLGVIAIGMSKNDDVQSISARVHPLFELLFPVVIYLTIGPLFAVPRTGTVSYEIGIAPFLSEGLKNIRLRYAAVLCDFLYRHLLLGFKPPQGSGPHRQKC